MSHQTIAYTKGGHQADAGVAPTDDGRFQGVVDLSHPGGADGSKQAERHLVPVASDSAEEALEEAKALAHRLLADLQ